VSDATLLTDGLTIGYDGRPVVRGLDVSARPGQVIALVGTNGSGKSTFLKTVVGLLAPVGGRIEVLGERPGARPDQVAYLSQFHSRGFVLPLQVRDVVRMGRFSAHGLLGRLGRADADLVEAAMERMAIRHLARRSLSELSGGQQQRVHLAQALSRQADLLVLDEPTAGIDAAGREIFEYVVETERARGATIVLATHDIGEAERADQVLLLAGRVVAQGEPAEVLTAPNLLDTFGIGLRRVDGGLLAGEQPHAHSHGNDDRELEGYHGGRIGPGLDDHAR
jgi:ABC-type Mn2+/Zn2+ transport system ATPase subunit